jgi:uncharacterized protein
MPRREEVKFVAVNAAVKWAGKWALVTGASAGIGKAIAEQLAAAGANLIVTARRTERLVALASDLSAKHGVKVDVIQADLTHPGATRDIHAFTTGKGLEIDLLVNNAGFGAFGRIHDIPVERLLEMIQVNCLAVVELTRLYLPAMIGRRRGDVLIVASTASFQPVPFISVYAATKAFDLIFAEGIAEEVRSFGVSVCALCPGTTETEFQEVAQQPNRAFRFTETAQKVARVGLEGLAHGETCVISGARNRWMVRATRLAPRRLVARMAARVMGPESARQGD